MKPSNASITIDGDKFNAIATHVQISTAHDGNGMPMMGVLQTVISATVDMHDNEKMPFATLTKIYNLAN